NNVNGDLDDNLSDAEDDETCNNREISEYIKSHNPVGGVSELRSSGMTNNIHTFEKECVLNLLGKIIQESVENEQNYLDAILMPHSNKPKN
ncbi:4492_t:CDS:1, partial [Racocetra persica]